MIVGSCYILWRCSILTGSPKYLRFTNFSKLSLKGKIINHLFCVCEMSWHLCLYCNLHLINSTNVMKIFFDIVFYLKSIPRKIFKDLKMFAWEIFVEKILIALMNMKNPLCSSFGVIALSDVEKLLPITSHRNWTPKTNIPPLLLEIILLWISRFPSRAFRH